MSETVALIPARGGSKGLPRKNVMELSGKPLIAWTIEAALATATPMRVIVSTDDAEIGNVASLGGAEVPFRRPDDLATDAATSLDVALHALSAIGADDDTVVILLQPTSPLRTAADIDAAMDLFLRGDADAVVSVVAVTHPPHWMYRIVGGELQQYATDTVARRQDAAPLVQVNGAVYVTRAGVLRSERTFMPPRTAPYLMPPERSIDIDSQWDFRLAALLLSEARP
jgi:CMP-N-acetylneuraminic acid synthetase